MLLNEVITRWTTVGAAPGLSVMYFDAENDIVNSRAALRTMLAAILGTFSNKTTFTIDGDGRVIESTTGIAEDSWSDATSRVGSGLLNAEQVPDAAQFLLRWRTSDYVNGRRVQGRTYLPGFATTSMSGGRASGPSIAAAATNMTTFINALTGFGIWARPVVQSDAPGAPVVTPREGSFHYVDTGTAWGELAVQRNRRL